MIVKIPSRHAAARRGMAADKIHRLL